MSSSGLIYAVIVGAWAVYLVPMWLRREDELNKARQTQRYTTAIKVLSNRESFERKHGASAEREETAELPVAVGAGAAGPAAGRSTLEKVREKDRERQRREGEARRGGEQQGREQHGRERPRAANERGREAVAARAPREARKPTVTARLPRESAHGAEARSVSTSTSTPASGNTQRPGAPTSGPKAAAAGLGSAQNSASHALLRLRRRRVVSVLFAFTSLGAIVSADLGLGYVWAMLIPAAVLSGYIVSVRKDERARVAERARRHAVASHAAAREAERRRIEEMERTQYEAELAEQVEREDFARRGAAARRRVAAARSRADRRPSPDQGDLPRAANG